MFERYADTRNLFKAVTAFVFILAALFVTGPLSAQGKSAPNQSSSVKVIAFGDSLFAGYGLPPGQSLPAQLEQRLRADGFDVQIVNAGVSGDTTATGLARFEWAIPDDADAVIVELGANDALRGISPDEARRNLEAILVKLQARKLPVLLAGMKALSNWGDEYREAFDPIYPDLARRFGTLLYPFILEGVVQNAKLNQPDGLHPNAAGVARIVEQMKPMVAELIEKAGGKRVGLDASSTQSPK